MSGYMTEEEQIAAIKKWWNKFSNPILFTISGILLLISGYKYWQWHEDKVMTQASVTFEQLMQSLSNHDIKAVRAYAEQLISTHPKTAYADVAELTLAKAFVNKADYKKAEAALTRLVNEGSTPVFKQIAQLRLARLLAQDKNYVQALSVLSVVNNEAYLPLVQELKGDIYAMRGQYQMAVEAYRAAMGTVKQRGMGNLYLEMKTNELASKASSELSKQQDKTAV